MESLLILTDSDLILVTGATGLVGSHVAEQARKRGHKVRAVVRKPSQCSDLTSWGVDLVEGDMTNRDSLIRAAKGATVVVHCAAKVGDWGPTEEYRTVNVHGLRDLLDAVESNGSLKRFVHISSLGVYPACDHHGTDEFTPVSTTGIDGYTLTKVEAENLVRDHIRDHRLPAVILRPGFIYGPRDRTILPKVLARIKSGGFKFLGSGQQLLNNTFVGNLVSAVFLAIEKDDVGGELFNITDNRLVSRREFIGTICEAAGLPTPAKNVPLPIAKALANLMEAVYRMLGKKEAPLLSSARIKFLGLNLDYSIDKARRLLGYDPPTDFTEAMRTTIAWSREAGLVG
ncbi:MAG: NAD-dependent epimerase/dehydratase [Planctomycetota bacterium]|nr:MAG: NAD-dependent epimerase/dehydratase [Planctomycetota bacterium]